MFALFLLALLLVPLVELWLIIEVWQQIGGAETILALIAISLVGAWLVKREGLGVWYRMNEQLARGRLPTNELVDGALILFAGALMLTPGFMTDAVGLLLLFPLSRAAIRAVARRRLERRIERGQAAIRFATFGAGTSRVGGFSRVYTVHDSDVGDVRRSSDVGDAADVRDVSDVRNRPSDRPGGPGELGP